MYGPHGVQKEAYPPIPRCIQRSSGGLRLLKDLELQIAASQDDRMIPDVISTISVKGRNGKCMRCRL